MRNAQHVNPYLLLSSRSFIVLLKQSQNDTSERSSDISSNEIMNIMTCYAAAADQRLYVRDRPRQRPYCCVPFRSKLKRSLSQ